MILHIRQRSGGASSGVSVCDARPYAGLLSAGVRPVPYVPSKFQFPLSILSR